MNVFVLIVAGVTLAFVIIVFISINNSLITVKNETVKAWANIDVILKQRFDEIPQLIEIANQYIAHEKNIINELSRARQLYLNANNDHLKIEASNQLSKTFSGLLALGESYPELKSNNNFMQLQSRISALEESLSHRREFYNDAVTNYNNMIEQFPSSIVAGQLKYRQKTLFAVAPHETSKPNLKLNV